VITYYDPSDVRVTIAGREITGFASWVPVEFTPQFSARVRNRRAFADQRRKRALRRRRIGLAHPYTGETSGGILFTSPRHRDQWITMGIGQVGNQQGTLHRIVLPEVV